MFDHLTLRASDRDESGQLYAALLGGLGVEPHVDYPAFVEWDDFGLARARGDRPPTTGLHIGFAAASRELVDAAWQAAVDAGFPSDGEPGPRPEYGPDYYGGFLRDPDGNSVEAVYNPPPAAGNIDHLWIRVADLEASTRFYELVAGLAGFRLASRSEDLPRTRFAGEGGSFSIVDDGTPAQNVHLAFPARDNATVDRFHAALVENGYRDNGAPGERSEYHEGYYGAFVLDPDGNNIELVNHNR